MPGKLKLTDNLKRVIVGMCKYPMESDSFIADKVRVKRSTFATAKNRLLDPVNPILTPVNIPNFYALGAELISISSGNINPVPYFRMKKENALKRLSDLPNIISTFHDTYSVFALLVSKSFTDLVFTQNSLAVFSVETEVLTPSEITRMIFPLKYNGLVRFLDFSHYFSDVWNISNESDLPIKPLFPAQKLNPNLISPLGWKIFDTIISSPEFSVLEIAKKLGKPRNTITRWIRKFQMLNLYRTCYEPDLIQIGLKIHLLVSIYIQGLEKEKLSEIIQIIDEIFHPSDILFSFQNIVFSTVFPDYNILKERENEFLRKIEDIAIHFTLNKYTKSIPNIQSLKSLKNSIPALIEYLRNSTKYGLSTS